MDSAVSGEDRKKIAKVWSRLAELPISRPDDTMEVMWDGLPELLDFDGVFATLLHRPGPQSQTESSGLPGGWNRKDVCGRGYSSERVRPFAMEFLSDRMESDRWTIFTVETCGEHRALLREDALGDEPWSSCEMGWLLEKFGATDRMVTAYAIDPWLELHLNFDRAGGENFSERDRAVMHEFNKGLEFLWTRLALSHGFYKNHRPLSPRQRQTLLHLLGGHSEKEIAERMNLTPASAHQYVVAVYRRLDVNSRAELMSKWMGDLDAWALSRPTTDQ